MRDRIDGDRDQLFPEGDPPACLRIHLWWCLDFASDGNISRHSADMAALAVGLSADWVKGSLETFLLAFYRDL
jgi:hypothetical protein